MNWRFKELKNYMDRDDLEKMLLDGYYKQTESKKKILEIKKKFSMSLVIEKCQRVGIIGRGVTWRERHNKGK